MKSELLTELGDRLLSGSLTDDELLTQTREAPPVRLLPDANVIEIGGQSFIDRGRAAVFPLIDEIVQNLTRHKMIPPHRTDTGAYLVSEVFGARSMPGNLTRALDGEHVGTIITADGAS